MRCLEKLENIIDLEHVKRTSDLQRAAFAFEPVDHIPTSIRYPLPAEDWPAFNFQEIYADMEWMLLEQLSTVYSSAKLKDDALYDIRANYGTGLVASLFGCPIHTFADTLPVATAAGDNETVRRIIAKGIPDLHSGIMGRALDTVAFYRDVLSGYPKLNKAVKSMLLDTQGTFDNASIIWGSSIYYALYDEPETIFRLLQLVTDTIDALVQEHRRIDGGELGEHNGEWQHLGGVCLRNDSCVTLGRAMFQKFVKPYDAQLMGKYGGWTHFCGKAHAWWQELLDLPGIRGINPYQGNFYDLLEMYPLCAARRVAIVQWVDPVPAEARERIHTGFSRMIFANNYSAAQAVLNRLYATGWADE